MSEFDNVKESRCQIFLDNFGSQKAWIYHQFIDEMKILYVGCIYNPIFDHDEFTSFIKDNASKFDLGSRLKKPNQGAQ